MTLREWLIANDWTQAEFARQAHFSAGTLKNWCNGHNAPSTQNRRRIEELTGGAVKADRDWFEDE